MFDRDFTTAKLDDGTAVQFTHSESCLLEYMARNPGLVLSRSQILDAISDEGSEHSDRSVDFLINRIRRKLNDDPKSPSFIATRYGGGYVWVGKKPTLGKGEAYVVLGAVKGMDTLGAQREGAQAFAHALLASIQAQLDDGQSTVLQPDFNPDAYPNEPPPIQVELVFFSDNSGPECVISCRSGASRRVYFAKRLELHAATGSYVDSNLSLADLAARILGERWRSDVDDNLDSTPLPVAMLDAGVDPDEVDSRIALKKLGPKILALRAQFPDDPDLKLKYATHIHACYVANGFELALRNRDQRAADEMEMERLVLEALDYAQSQPHLAVMAAKLLYFVNKGYKSFALDLSANAHRASTSIASTLAIWGQFQTHVGEMDSGIENLKQALTLAQDNDRFRDYTQILLCQALVAADRRDELEIYRERLSKGHPLLRLLLEPIFTNPDRPSMFSKGFMLVLSQAKANALLSHLHYCWARLYEDQTHRENALRAVLGLTVRRFGRDVVPDEIKRDLPDLFD